MTPFRLHAAMVTTETEVAEAADDEVVVFREPETKVRPGDIVRLSPWLKPLKQLQHLDRQETPYKGKQTAARVDIADAPKNIREGKADARLIVESKLEWGLLLTRGCDIDHSKERQLVVLRSLAEFNEHRAPIIRGERVSLHYIPAPASDSLGIGERVADFRFVVTLHKDLFDGMQRPLSLTPTALLDLYFTWMNHTLGKSVPETMPCPKCETPVDVLRFVEAIATPSGDY